MMLLFLFFASVLSLPAGFHCNFMNATYWDPTFAGKCDENTLVQFTFGIIPPTMTGGLQCGVCKDLGTTSTIIVVNTGRILQYSFSTDDCNFANVAGLPTVLKSNESCDGYVAGPNFIATFPEKMPEGKEWWPRTVIYNTTGTCTEEKYAYSDVFRKPGSCLPNNKTTFSKLVCSADSTSGKLELHDNAGCTNYIHQDLKLPVCSNIDPYNYLLKGVGASCTAMVSTSELPTAECRVGVYTYTSSSSECKMDSSELIAVENTVFDVILATQGFVGKECGKCNEKSAYASYKLFTFSDGTSEYNATAVWTWNKGCTGNFSYLLKDKLPSCHHRQVSGALKKVLKLGNNFDDFPAQTANWAAANIYPSELGCLGDVAVGKARVRPNMCAGPGENGFRKVVCTQGGAKATSWATSPVCTGGYTKEEIVTGSSCTFSTVLDNKWLKSTKCPWSPRPKQDAGMVMTLSLVVFFVALLLF